MQPLDDAQFALEGWSFYCQSKEPVGAFFLDCLTDPSVHASIEDKEASPAVYQAFAMMLLWKDTRFLVLKNPLFVATALSLDAPGEFFHHLRIFFAQQLVLSDALPSEKEDMAKMVSLLWGEGKFFEALIDITTQRDVISRGLVRSFLASFKGSNKTPSDIAQGGDSPMLQGMNSIQIENVSLFCDKTGHDYAPDDKDVAQYFISCFEQHARSISKYANLEKQWDFYQRKNVAPGCVSCKDFVHMILDGKSKDAANISWDSSERIEGILKSLRERDFLSAHLLGNSDEPKQSPIAGISKRKF